ncbi:MAG: DUF91 domain-containing protein [Oscillatoria sp. SIO1A7]|nr:DUF91 domain-containing protein [Oscillatoria sp. SIO1A7]
MFNYVTLRKTGDRWEFDSEAALEDFLWDKLEPLFALKPLKRQYNANEQFCDILGTSDRQQLAILELKNSEDRYVVQQLTRYYDVLVEQKSFAEVDYEQPIRLAAIAPSFHRDNFTDLKYHLLASQFEFWQFSIVEEGEKFYFDLKNLQREATCRAEIPYRPEAATPDIPPPPRKLLGLIEKYSDREQEAILKVRWQILNFDGRLQEVVSGGSIKYGNGNSKKSKFCAEFCSDSKENLILFLWFPLKGGTSDKLGRARIWTDWNNRALIEGYVSSGIGAKVTSRKRVMANLTEQFDHKNYAYISSRNRKSYNRYVKEHNRIQKAIREGHLVLIEEIRLLEKLKKIKYPVDRLPYSNLEKLVETALERWLVRL